MGLYTLEQSKSLLRTGFKASQRFDLHSPNNSCSSHSKFTFRTGSPCADAEMCVQMCRFKSREQDREGGEASPHIQLSEHQPRSAAETKPDAGPG